MMIALLKDDRNITAAAADAVAMVVVAKRGLERRQQEQRWFS